MTKTQISPFMVNVGMLYYWQGIEDKNKPKEILTIIPTLAICENCKGVTHTTSEDRSMA